MSSSRANASITRLEQVVFVARRTTCWSVGRRARCGGVLGPTRAVAPIGRLAIAVMVLALVACGGSEPGGAFSSPTSQAATYDSLLQRPVALPAVSPGSLCPVSSRVVSPELPKGSFVPNGFGGGPVYLTGQVDRYSGETARLVVDPAYSGIVLVRGKQLDGPQGMPLVAAPPGPSPDLEIPAEPSSSYGREWVGQLVVSGPGCFGLQVDGVTFEEGIVLEVQPGTSPVPAGP